MIAKVDPSRKYVTAAPTTPAKPMAVNTFHAGVMDWPCGCVAMQAPFHKTCSKTSRLLRPSIVHQGDSQTRQAVNYSEYSDCDTRTQNRCCLPIVVNDAECPDQAQNPTCELSTPNMVCRSRWGRSHRERYSPPVVSVSCEASAVDMGSSSKNQCAQCDQRRWSLLRLPSTLSLLRAFWVATAFCAGAQFSLLA